MALAAALLIGCGGKEERKAKYMERGKDYLAEQNFDKAKIEFKNVLQIDPKTAEAFYYLGEIEEAGQDWSRAFGSYRKAAELDPELLPARIKLAQFYLAQAGALGAREDSEGAANALALAKEEVDAVLQRSPEDPEGLTVQARLWLQEGQGDAARAQLERVLAQHAGLNTAIMALANLHESADSSADAERVLLAGIKASDKPTPLRVQLSQFYIREERYAEAQATLRALIQENPDVLGYRLSLASLLSRTEELDAAEKVLREAIQADPDDAQRYVLLAEFLATRRSREAAIEQLGEFIRQHPEMAELRFSLAKLRLENDQLDEAKKVLEEVIAQQDVGPAGLRARVTLAQVLASEDPTSPRVGTLLDEVLAENPRDNAALLMKGKLEAQKGDYVDAIANFRSVLRDQPDSAEVLQLLAQAHLANGERELARDTMGRAMAANPGNIDLQLAMARLLAQDGKTDQALERIDEVLERDHYHETALSMKYGLLALKGDAAGMEEVVKQMQAGAPEKDAGFVGEARLRAAQMDFGAALKILNDLLERNPDSTAALVAKTDVLSAQKQYDDAIEVTDRIIELRPDSAEGYFRKARLLQEKGDVDAALKYYDLALDKSPDSESALTEMTKLALSSGHGERIAARLEKLIEANPDHPSANGFIGLIRADANDLAGAEAAFARQIEITPEDPEAYTRLAQTRAAGGDLDGAVAAFERGLKALPESPQLLIGLAGVRERQRNYDAAISLYEQVLARQPDNAISINNLAALLADHRPDEASLAKAVDLSEKLESTNQPAFLDTAGWVYYRTGDYAKALPLLERAVEEAPQVPVFRYHLGMLYLKQGDKAAAKEHLTKATNGDFEYQGIEEARTTLESL